VSNVYALRDRAESGSARSIARLARPALIVLSAACAAVLLGKLVAEPLMTIRHVAVQSDVPLADEQVLRLAGLQGSEHWYSLDAVALERRLESSPLIRHARVEKRFPDTVRMTIWGRQPAALVLATSGGRSIPVIVDGDGVVFRIGATSAEIDLPVISGLIVGDTTLGGRLPRAYAALFSDLRALREKSPSLYALVSEVRVVPSGDPAAAQSSGSFDLLLYLTAVPVAVRTRGAVDETLLKYTLMVIELLSKQGVLQDIQELDFRGGAVVYKLRGVPTRE